MKTPWLEHYKTLGINVPDLNDPPLGAFLEQHASERPDNAALWYVARAISYGELHQHVNRFANALSAAGIGKGDVVGIHLPNIPQYIIALGAISKLGAIGSGVSPLLAPPELAYQINDAQMKAVLTLNDFSAAFAAMTTVPDCLEAVIIASAKDLLAPDNFDLLHIEGVTTHRYLDFVGGQSNQFEHVKIDPHDTYMIQYTGGTTGKPKGAMLSHRNIMHNTAQTSSMTEFELGKEVMLSAFPLFHVAGLSIGICALRYGAMMILVPNPRDTDFICTQMEKFPVNIMAAVPALIDMLVANPKFATLDFSKLRAALTGAAPMTRSSYDAFSAIVGEKKLTDIFGMTETGPCYTTNPPERYKLGSVGIPLPNVTVRIRDVDTGLQDMPYGEPGEITCTGPQVMKGYLNLPKETDNALREIEGERYMFSGDVGYMDEEGYIFLCDRAKDMLIVGGYKVFSVEVEDKLSAFDEIAACAIIGTKDEDRPGNDIVNLFVELSPAHKNTDQDALRDKIIAFCREKMAAYKVPKKIHFIDAIPLTPVGKIDKKALRVSA
jgi:long-chain acyl-CoA synthetase